MFVVISIDRLKDTQTSIFFPSVSKNKKFVAVVIVAVVGIGAITGTIS